MPLIQVTHVFTGRIMVGTPDELLEGLGRWWPDAEADEGAIAAHITQAVYEWETGQFDGWRNAILGVQVAPVG